MPTKTKDINHEAKRVELELAAHRFPKRMTAFCDVLGDDPDWPHESRDIATFELAGLLIDELVQIGEFVR